MDSHTTPTSKAKVSAIHVRDLAWHPAEDDSGGRELIAEGYLLSIAPEPEGKRWSWIVRTTAEISETPEVIDAGTAKSEKSADWQTGIAANKALKARLKAEKPATVLKAPRKRPADLQKPQRRRQAAKVNA